MVEYLPISQARMLKIKQTSDVTHELLKKTILQGWPRTKESTPMEVHPYFHVNFLCKMVSYTEEPTVSYQRDYVQKS